MKKAVILLSGGLDSSTVLAMAKADGYECYALSFSYGQRSTPELQAAARMAKHNNVADHRIIELDLGQLGGSALTDHDIDVPDADLNGEIPVTYVPARNTVFLSIALGWAEVLGATDIFIGANAVDYSGYPDCRPEYLAQFEKLANLATKVGVESNAFKIHAPLLNLSKAQIIQAGTQLGVDYGRTCSCYQCDEAGRACGRCDSCALRRQGFADAGVSDPTPYYQ
jgi:7-cyano-7-deazaguanine synthase